MRLAGTATDEPSTDVIQGTLDMLILKTLSLEPMHGFGIARRIEQISRGVFKVNPGSLLTAFQRLERPGWLDAEWQQTLTVLGAVLGLMGAPAAGRVIVTLLFGVSRLDPFTYVAVIALLLAVSAVACWVPAWRAARVDPVTTLRAE